MSLENQWVNGIRGYANATQKFIEATLSIDFWDLHRDFIEFIPKKKLSQLLDIGAGIGRDAWELSKMGHSVVAVEPTKEYLEEGKRLFDMPEIKWIDDSLPNLALLTMCNHFDFILASGVFHHLDSSDQKTAIMRVSQLLKTKGVFALSLRNGPPGVGTWVFPTDSFSTIKNAKSCGLDLCLRMDNQPSLLRGKENVTWSKLVFQKT
ncbi:bifunctional 2-polyprenyl-6-hydroxyphenol methylase/3-demethylubiquinol 3-O-methyltransferase UbiG [Algoriphagus sp. Y33]|uniref:class I SAM-dependent methyltransferase n=1 Tax=Algoriphagus sp. Y33 TaxID=2772483 RepID=UPI00177B228E|nr:class I SAM-dependent methyltransferase [Algoriphagus sp. Y33]